MRFQMIIWKKRLISSAKLEVKNTEYSTNNWIRAQQKQKNINEYSVSSIKAAVSAIYRHSHQRSVITNYNLLAMITQC
ncbi:10425_t:CDS:2 [Funneliformis mosseae]|uniref:10425_t:CDS:1 n=1 Tax=Funneliformis mosseae TaxID=27381 RepID=A0A9N9DEB0_FUNMO|nr:10425_t:CDS:2 [Funneliformis mosseae]